MSLHMNVYSFVYRGEDAPENKNVIWIHHQKKNDLQSPILAEIWIKNEWRPFVWGNGADDVAECCCCGSPFVRDEGKNSATMRAASNTARGEFSFVAGHKSHAFGNRSMAIGTGVVADLEDQIVLGKYNDRTNDYKFAIGIGEDDANRKNAITIDEHGAIAFYNSSDGQYYTLSQIINSIGRGEILLDDFIISDETVELVPDV